MKLLHVKCCLFALLVVFAPAHAQTFPSKTIRIRRSSPLTPGREFDTLPFVIGLRSSGRLLARTNELIE